MKLSRGVHQWTWANLGNDDVGDPIDEGVSFADKTVTIVAVAYGSATAAIQGSNDKTNWFDLESTNGAGTALTFTTGDQLHGILQNPKHIRPKTSGGTGTDITVVIVGRAILQLR